jgi:hypothetical protein
VVVAGALANKAFNGGEAWVRLSWVLGFQALGLDAYFVEQIDRSCCVGADGAAARFEDSINRAYFRDVTNRFGLAGRSSLVCGDGECIDGVDGHELSEIAGDALLVNISGNLRWRALRDRFRRSAFIDIDPGFTQGWHQAGLGGLELGDYDTHYTIGENIGSARCLIPAGGIDWRPIRQPVLLDQWPVSSEGDRDRFTTIARWRAPFGAPDLGGRSFGLKHHQFRRFADLPGRIDQSCELALSIDADVGGDLEMLRAHGWTIADAAAHAADPEAFRRYVQSSGAEFSVAQGIYVDTWSGWFSDRTVRYLASGKPALVQDTGFSVHYPTGLGLVAFRTLDEAVAGAASIRDRYDEHCAAARAIAEDYFDASRVLQRFLDDGEFLQ